MLSTKTDDPSYKTYLNWPFDRFLEILLGHFTRWISSAHSRPSQRTVSVKIVSQIPQSHLSFYPRQAYGAHDQLPNSFRLHPKDMFHTTPNSRTRSIPLQLSVRQLPMLAPLPLKILPIFRFLQLPQLLLRKVRRIRPYVSTAVILIQKLLKNLTVMDRRRSHLITANQLMEPAERFSIMPLVKTGERK